MANYVVGDIQGCLSGLLLLLEKVSFDPQKDKLWAVGDLIARGNESLETLLFLQQLGDAFSSVLGNHDLHFLATHAGIKTPKKADRLEKLLKYEKVGELVDWLRQMPLAIRYDKHTLITHAGLYPQWSFKKAIKLSDEVSQQLQSDGYVEFLRSMYGNEPRRWKNTLTGEKRLRFVVNAMTRMRFLTDKDSLEFETKTSPKEASKALRPWFSVTNSHLSKQHKVIFGHWATLMGNTQSAQFIGLDTGYVWRNHLTLYDLDNGHMVSIKQTR